MTRRVLFFAVMLSAACSLTTSLDGLTGGPDPSTPETGPPDVFTPDVVPIDAPSDVVDAATDAPVVGPNLYPAGTFDTSDNICSGTAYHSKVDRSMPGRASSPYACQICATGSASDIYTLDRFTGIVPHAGETYRVTAWMKIDGAAVPPAGGVMLAVRSAVIDPFEIYEQSATPNVAATTEWQQLTVDLVVTRDAPSLEYFVGGPFDATSCFLVDDVEIRKVN